MYISVNGTLINASALFVSPLSESFMYGYGLFETLKVYNNKILFIEDHLNRLKKDCSSLNLTFNYTLEHIKKYCNELITANKISFGALKVMYTKNKEEHTLFISSRRNPYTKEQYEKGFSLCFAETKKNPYSKLTFIKSNNYLENVLERQKASQNNYDEAIFLNINNKISEGTYTNIFFVKDQVVYTPSRECGLLPGILREKVVDLSNVLNLKLKEGLFDKHMLLNSDEVFITNSLMDIMPICKIEGQTFSLNNNHITQKLQKEFYKYYK